MRITRPSVRRNALEKLAELSTKSPEGSKDLARLCKLCPKHKVHENGHAIANGNARPPHSGPGPSASQVPMGLSELEVLLALCRAAHQITDIENAERLLQQLSPYLPESHSQAIAPSPFLRDLDPSPWESLTFELTSALLSLGLAYKSLRPKVTETFKAYVEGAARAAHSVSALRFGEQYEGEDGSEEEAIDIAILAISMIGFLEAAATKPRFWEVPERLELIRIIQGALSEDYMIALEGALSSIRNSHNSTLRQMRAWRRHVKHYAAAGRPLGAMLLRQSFMRLVTASAALLVATPEVLEQGDILVSLERKIEPYNKYVSAVAEEMVDSLAEIAAKEVGIVEDDSDYLRLGSAWQQRLAFAVKAYALTVFLCCVLLNEDIADADVLLQWLDNTLSDPVQMADDNLAPVVFRCVAILTKTSPAIASSLSRSLPRFIVQGGLSRKMAAVAADSLSSILKQLPPDATISTLYSLGNVLSAGAGTERATPSPFHDSSRGSSATPGPYGRAATGSSISLDLSEGDDTALVYGTIVETIVGVASSSGDEKIAALALTMLVQKVGRVSMAVDASIIAASATLVVHGTTSDFKSLLKFYAKVVHDALIEDNALLLNAVITARCYLSANLKRGAVLYEPYLHHLMDTVVSRGDAHDDNNHHHHSQAADVELATQEISQLFEPLALLVSSNADAIHGVDTTEEIINMERDCWFNIVVHGFNLKSSLGQKYLKELKLLAQYSRPLIADSKVDKLESDIELNTVLRRGSHSKTADMHKKYLASVLPQHEGEVKGLSYQESVFLTAAHMVETLRASTGDCTKALTYFMDPKLKTGTLGLCMEAIALGAVQTYLTKTLAGNIQAFSAPYLAIQLASIFTLCCHRVPRVQDAARRCADLIMNQAPVALCQKTSLFALLELLTLMWTSCLEAETDEYGWKTTYTSPMGNITVELSDDYDYRKQTLRRLNQKAREWVTHVTDIAPMDVKGLLQTYLSEYDDDGAYGHISLGRSFALEMGSFIPQSDQRLGAIEDLREMGINTGSDFVAQYTTRQEYRYAGSFPDCDVGATSLGGSDVMSSRSKRVDSRMEDATSLLADLESRTLHHQHVPIAELRDVLRRAAALLCRSNTDQCAIVQHLVGIPFAIFTKQSMKLGISLWLGVIKENPRMEARILTEVATNWERTIHRRQGIYNEKVHHQDPFYIKEEFAPSDKETLTKRQQFAHNLIAPHFRLVQFLSSHFSATRLTNPYVQRLYHRLMHVSLDHMQRTTNHPLAREVHYHIVLLGLKILLYSTSLNTVAQWRLKDRILSAALTWFARPPSWSFGSNKLQVKAETQLLSDVRLSLKRISTIGQTSKGALKSLTWKQELLDQLLESEQARLIVWQSPVDHHGVHRAPLGQYSGTLNEANISTLVKTAWAENPALAVHMTQRFTSTRLASEVRWLVLNFTEKVIDEPDALHILLGNSLPNDVTFQLKYLTFWAPVNPITAVTYFLPAYGNHPFIIQYAMRALESHSVDVTFFYVPQIVQTLRYDVLGYVERYIIETAKFSQLFAHQIIWNMKANAFKDEDSQIPDPVKPTLDKVMDSLIGSFSKSDKIFYEREFGFFNEVTSISGKLRPFIKRPKPEKKQKIEEELRKIQVEVGVYLPSNPDGVVIGIDRKSGKPLQSHAKAPFMATFRIRKEKSDAMEAIENDLGASAASVNAIAAANGSSKQEKYYEVWQSAIFKVGDDCRQDVLALQMIAAFRGIFNNVGLDVYVFPYRVTATAPGCGVIDVLPNSISRDMIGREAVNGLYDYFKSKYGSEDSIAFQTARANFVKSMAAYSVISYLLQFKDRHNGNIMVDDQGHILHIDFGFCFDIAPGGVRFERAPFKLTSEMVAVMGGKTDSQAYRTFEALCVKAFLAVRQHCEKLIHIVVVMLDSGLPCFKPETIQHFRDRFVLGKTEKEAADFMRGLVDKSYRSYSTKGYDQFQLLTNGIPY